MICSTTRQSATSLRSHLGFISTRNSEKPYLESSWGVVLGSWSMASNSPLACPEEIEGVPAMCHRFSVSIDVGQAKAVAAEACALATEAFLVGMLLDDTVDVSTKKRKIEREIALLDAHKQAFGETIQVHPRVMTQSTNYLLV